MDLGTIDLNCRPVEAHLSRYCSFWELEVLVLNPVGGKLLLLVLDGTFFCHFIR